MAHGRGHVVHPTKADRVRVHVWRTGCSVLQVVDRAPQCHALGAVGVVDPRQGARRAVSATAGHHEIAAFRNRAHRGIENGMVRRGHHCVFLHPVHAPYIVAFLEPGRCTGNISVEQVARHGGKTI